MSTSGQGVGLVSAYVDCTNDVFYWQHFWDVCNFTGVLDVEADMADGSVFWTCPYCKYEHETTTDRLGLA